MRKRYLPVSRCVQTGQRSSGMKTGCWYFPPVLWRGGLRRRILWGSCHGSRISKIRAGFGTAGNNRIGDLLYLQLHGVTGEYALNHSLLPGFIPSSLANEKLRWERTVSQNIGLDLSFFNNRIQPTTDVYYNKGKDLLLAVAIPPITGYSSQLQNVGSTSNKGIEFQLNANVSSKRILAGLLTSISPLTGIVE